MDFSEEQKELLNKLHVREMIQKLSIDEKELTERRNHDIFRKKIIRAISDAFKKGKSCYVIIKIPRGVGKTRTIIETLVKYASSMEGKSILAIGDSKEQAKAVLHDDNDYLFKFGVDVKTPNWSATKNGYRNNNTRSSLSYAGVADSRSIQRNRGRHPHIIWHDEAQLFENPQKWLSIFGSMGEAKNCVKILSGTGGYKENNLMSYVENKIIAGRMNGVILKLTIEDILSMDRSWDRLSWYDTEVEKFSVERPKLDENSNPVFKDGTPVLDLIQPGDKTPEFHREFYMIDIGGTAYGELKYPMFNSTKHVIEGDYKINFREPVYVVMDYGTSDAYCATFYQVVGDMIIGFDEMYSKRKHRTQTTFGHDLAEKFDELGLARVSFEDIGERVKVNIEKIHKDIIFLGDNNGFSNWNPYIAELFDETVNGVKDTGLKAENGLDLITDFLVSGQLKLHDSMFNLISHISTVKMLDKIHPKFHLSIDHNKSHTIVTLSYILQYLMGNMEISLVYEGISEEKTNVKETEKYEDLFIPYKMYNNMNKKRRTIRSRIFSKLIK